MHCVYEKDSKDVECSPDMYDQSFKCNSFANLEKNDLTMMTKDIVDCLGEDMMVLLPNPSRVEGHVEDKSSLSTKCEDSMQKSCKEDVHQSLNDFSRAPLLEESGFGETTEVDFVVSDDCLEKAIEEENEEARDRDGDKTIKRLKEEVRISICIYSNIHILMHSGRVSLFLWILLFRRMRPPIDVFLFLPWISMC